MDDSQDLPAPPPEELTLKSLLNCAAQLAVDLNPQDGDQAVIANIKLAREIRARFNKEGPEEAYEFLRRMALFSLRSQGIGRSLEQLARDY